MAVDPWEEYIRTVQSGGQVQQQQPQQTAPGGLLGILFGLGNKNQTPTGAGPGQVPKPNKQGMYTPGLQMAAAGPTTPINYSAIKHLLNSGVMQTGKVAPMPEPVVEQAPAPTPVPKPEGGGNPFANILSALFGFGG